MLGKMSVGVRSTALTPKIMISTDHGPLHALCHVGRCLVMRLLGEHHLPAAGAGFCAVVVAGFWTPDRHQSQWHCSGVYRDPLSPGQC
jgi:hypothetical protein